MKASERVSRDEFLIKTEVFFTKFRPRFIDFFIGLCHGHDTSCIYEEGEVVGGIIYDSLFLKKKNISQVAKDIYQKFNNTVLVNFLIARVTSFLVYSFNQEIKDKDSGYEPNLIINLIDELNVFIKEFESNQNQPALPKELKSVYTGKDSSEQESITTKLKKYQASDIPIELCNFYKGVFIRSDAKILSVDDDGVLVQTSNDQLNAILYRKKAGIIRKNDFSQYIRCDCTQVNFLNNTVLLNEFTQQFIFHESAFYLSQVSPVKPVHVNVEKADNYMLDGLLLHISKNEICVGFESVEDIKEGEYVDVSCEIELGNSTISIAVVGKVIEISTISNSLKVSIHFEGEHEDIEEYVVLREKEIVQELR